MCALNVFITFVGNHAHNKNDEKKEPNEVQKGQYKDGERQTL
jgi:hypothetical protein